MVPSVGETILAFYSGFKGTVVVLLKFVLFHDGQWQESDYLVSRRTGEVEQKGYGRAKLGSVTGPSLPRMCLWPLHPSERSVFLFWFLIENWVSLPLSYPSQLLGGETPFKGTEQEGTLVFSWDV